MGPVARRQPLVEFVGERLLQSRRPIRQRVRARQRQAGGMAVSGKARQLEWPDVQSRSGNAEYNFGNRAIERERGVVRAQLHRRIRAGNLSRRWQISHGGLPSRGSHAT